MTLSTTRRPLRARAAAACASIAIAAAAAAWGADGAEQPGDAGGPQAHISSVPPIPATPAAIAELVLARPFTLDEPYVHEWRTEKPRVDAGWIIVVRAERDLVRPRQVAQPVLMVGSQVAEPMNIGYGSGLVVALVPAQRAKDGTVDLDLSAVPIWFAQPELPERMDAGDIDAQRRLAEASGIGPGAAATVDAAKARGGAIARLADREALDKVTGALIRTHAPDESERADQLEGVVTQAANPK